MPWCKEWKQGRNFVLTIKPGQKIVERLELFAKENNVKNAVIDSAIGSVKNVHFRGIKAGAKRPITLPRMRQHEIAGPLELLGLEGNLIINVKGEADCHLHILVSKSSGEVLGGHLYDAEVFASCELLLTEMLVEGIGRQVSEVAGTTTIFIDEE